jgi:hypothetical protein
MLNLTWRMSPFAGPALGLCAAAVVALAWAQANPNNVANRTVCPGLIPPSAKGGARGLITYAPRVEVLGAQVRYTVRPFIEVTGTAPWTTPLTLTLLEAGVRQPVGTAVVPVGVEAGTFREITTTPPWQLLRPTGAPPPSLVIQSSLPGSSSCQVMFPPARSAPGGTEKN